MHLLLMALALMGGWLLRWKSAPIQGNGAMRWQFALSRLILPPLLLLTTSIAVLWMGMDGAMLGFSAGWIGCHLAKAILAFALLTLLIWAGQGWRSSRQVKQYPCETVAQSKNQSEKLAHTSAHLLDTEIPFAAQVGFWRSKLVISRGLLNQLNDEQLEAVLTHEEAHAYYRDTFWFFWLGWLGHLTFWLPQTETLWQELLLLRELRADAWAAKKVDAIVVAESLLQIVQNSQISLTATQAGFNSDLTPTRLEERIDALLDPLESIGEPGRSWVWLGVGLLPLLTLPLHG
ncbi:M56 family metallopeptidase [Leptolyngbya ohadii]|uniref:M56 family metallopeptidase n=1 Tax=Leptolyngbya ohadii TaxID=1962290 RepID=UPI000B59BA88|nr:M56 family metallopeptidase [Leptolyngbya ohadii]